MIKELRYLCQAALLYLLYFLFRILPVDMASALGGFIGRTVGPFLALTDTAYKNIRLALPETSEQDAKIIIRDVWNNVGRIFGEYPHLDYIVKNRVTCNGREVIVKAHEEGKAILFVSGHLANWEVMALYAALITGHIHSIYRKPNNPYAARLLEKVRDKKTQSLIPKSRGGTRNILQALKKKESVGLLVDQKYNEGIAVPFFGHDAMTGDAFVNLAQKFDATVIFGALRREKGAHFTLKIFAPLTLYKDDGTPREAYEILRETHEMLENEIRKDPAQWLWLHRRWPKNAYKKADL